MEYCAELPADVMQKCSVCHLGTNLFAKPTTADCGKKNHEHKDLLSTVMTKRQERCHATAINSTHHS